MVDASPRKLTTQVNGKDFVLAVLYEFLIDDGMWFEFEQLLGERMMLAASGALNVEDYVAERTNPLADFEDLKDDIWMLIKGDELKPDDWKAWDNIEVNIREKARTEAAVQAVNAWKDAMLEGKLPSIKSVLESGSVNKLSLCCPSCQSNEIKKSGKRETNDGSVQRYGCKVCGHKFTGNRAEDEREAAIEDAQDEMKLLKQYGKAVVTGEGSSISISMASKLAGIDFRRGIKATLRLEKANKVMKCTTGRYDTWMVK